MKKKNIVLIIGVIAVLTMLPITTAINGNRNNEKKFVNLLENSKNPLIKLITTFFLYLRGNSIENIFSLQNKDFLETEYNYRITFEGLGYFDVYLEYGRWAECGDEDFTDLEVISHFKLLRVSPFNN